MRRVNILGVEISAVNKETAIQYLLENIGLSSGSKQFIYDFARWKALI